MTFVSTTYSFQ